MRAIYFLAIVVYLILLSPVLAATLGGIIDKTSMTINKGNVGVFEISVFSLEDVSLEVSVNAGKVEDLNVQITPKNFDLQGGLTASPTGDSSWVIIEGDKYAKLHKVQVYVRTPDQITANYYNIPIIVSAAGNLNKNGGNDVVQNVVQALQYNLRIYVPGSVTRTEEYVDLNEESYNLSNYPAYQLPGIKPTNYQASPTGEYQKVPPPVRDNVDKDLINSGDSNDAQGNVPIGYLFFDKDNGNINWGLIVLIVAVISLIIYLVKK